MILNDTILRVTATSLMPQILRELKEGTPRATRNAIDLMRCLTDSRESRQLLSKMTQHCTSTLIQQYTAAVDEEIIHRLLINLGINSFSIGATRLLEHNKGRYKQTQWLEPLDLLALKKAGVITAFNEAGCYAFILNGMTTDERLKRAVSLAAAHVQSTFFLAISGGAIHPHHLLQLKGVSNVIAALCIDESNPPAQMIPLFDTLRVHRLFFGFYTAQEIHPQTMADMGCLFGVYTQESIETPTHNTAHPATIPLFDYERDRRYVNDLLMHKKPTRT